MTTFSQLVDSMVAETRRPDMLNEIISYLNQTLREVHFTTEQVSKSILYKENFNEALLTANVESGFQWYIPDPATFQAMQVVRYLLHCGHETGESGSTNEREWPPELTPSRGLAGRKHFYYRAGGVYTFSGYGGLNAQIGIGWYAYPRRLKYYQPGMRPAEYDPDMGWTYNPAFNIADATRLSAQAYTSNWLLLRWVDVIAEGVRAKVYKRVSDTDRARTCYSLYSSLRQGLDSSENAVLGGFG